MCTSTDNQSHPTNDGSGTTDGAPRKCLNCGYLSDGKFCPDCGQSMDTGRLTSVNFLKTLFKGLFRLTDTFFHTCWLLMTRPWIVIKDYVYGRRIGYTNPVSLLLILCLYVVVIVQLLNIGNVSESIKMQMAPHGAGYTTDLFDYFVNSIGLQWLLTAIPISLAVKIAYHNSIKNRFNYPELLVATIYFCCVSMIYNLLLIPLELLNKSISTPVNVVITLVLGVIAIQKAFPQKSIWISIWKYALMILCGAILFVIMMVLVITAVATLGFFVSQVS